MKTVLLFAVWTVLLVAAGGVALHLWLELEDVRLGFHGWLALGLGVGLSLIVGISLMTLVFHSARHGYDEGAAPPEDDERAKRERDDTQR